MKSRIKFKVCDLATGNKFADEWTIFPNDWPFDSIVFEPHTLFERNFVELDIDMDESILFLNLATRELFRIPTFPLEEEIRELTANIVDENGEPYILERRDCFQNDAG